MGLLDPVQAERVEAYEHYAQLTLDVTVMPPDTDHLSAASVKSDEAPTEHMVTFVMQRHILLTLHRHALDEVRHSMADYRLDARVAARAAAAATTTTEHSPLLASLHGREMPPPSPPAFLQSLLRHFAASCEQMLNEAEEGIEQLQEQALEVPQAERADMLRRMGLTRQALIELQRRLLRKRLVLRDALNGRGSVFIGGDSSTHLQAALDEIDELTRDLATLRDSLTTAQSNYLSKISIDMAVVAQETSETVKIFAVATTLAIPVTSIGGLLGMNVYFPGRAAFMVGGIIGLDKRRD